MQSKPELEVIVPEWNAPENIKAFFTLRSGGMSACAYGDKDGFAALISEIMSETISTRFAEIAEL